MRDRVTTALELAGLVSVTTGAAMFSPALGFAVGGAALVLVGSLLGATAGDDE